MKDIYNDYKFIRWLKIIHPQNYEFLQLDFEDFYHFRLQEHKDYLFLMWFKFYRYNWLYYEYRNEFKNDENFNIKLEWEKGF